MKCGLVVPLAAVALGCQGSVAKLPPDRALPFVVKCEELRLSRTGRPENAVTPAVFTDTKRFTRAIAEGLEAAGIFTLVVTGDDSPMLPDLVLELEVNRDDFGESAPTVWGAISSTLAWMFAGPASWWIDNRTYPDSEASLRVTLREPPGPDAGAASTRQRPPVFEDHLFLRGLELNFAERADIDDWFWNILIPPWLSVGDPENAGRSLVERSPSFFTQNETQRILASFPAFYVRRLLCYLGFDPERMEIVVVSKADLDNVTIDAEGAEVRRLGEDELAALEAEGTQKEELWRWLTERAVGLAVDPGDQYFRIPLHPIETGFVRIEAILEGGERPVRWTIYRGDTAER